ncbi:MAG: Holliday junction branch migration DNA helicase RuvB [Candidatus Harrisonbacteria bacterium CG10_big_fil_rev_8_21_14_0_10_44_23]|uniref:Holliday junction branch migration complex subunit RuvB n=1 Tax=Candidatus Harrisonbacteria bacterium CG10_big_fil_rev_8_21_14_0_10_44_23 TaxID=1974585 RepID=A0A2H0UQ61_9BACT|nr:MAG: Holliday junction branch migration DNA helicase RuvB [Candidatus Harrisonbacteria bacterium CG10_big_fil_rev_8_21_14_0_10_44_23]
MIMEEKDLKISPQAGVNDQAVDQVLRPQNWDDYVGQAKVKQNLRIIIDAAKKREESCDHLLFFGQAGLGKTTLANLVAGELGANLKTTSGPALEKMGDLAAVLTNLNKGDVLFIDEVHRLNRMIEEVLYPAMEMRKLHLIVGKGPGARTLSLDLPPFTLVAATTRPNLLSSPLRSRFGASFKLDYYQTQDIEDILKRNAKLLNLNVDEKAISLIAKASRATPRVANRLLRRVRDYAQVHNHDPITEEAAKKTLELLEVDELGLDPHDRRVLEVIAQKFNYGPVGLGSLAAALNEDKSILEDVYEPYLISIGMLMRTPAGRRITEDAIEHLKKYNANL